MGEITKADRRNQWRAAVALSAIALVAVAGCTSSNDAKADKATVTATTSATPDNHASEHVRVFVGDAPAYDVFQAYSHLGKGKNSSVVTDGFFGRTGDEKGPYPWQRLLTPKEKVVSWCANGDLSMRVILSRSASTKDELYKDMDVSNFHLANVPDLAVKPNANVCVSDQRLSKNEVDVVNSDVAEMLGTGFNAYFKAHPNEYHSGAQPAAAN